MWLAVWHLSTRHTGARPRAAPRRRGWAAPGAMATPLVAGAAVRLSEDVLDRIDQIVPPGIDVGLNQANYMPPALVTPELRRRPAADRAAA